MRLLSACSESELVRVCRAQANWSQLVKSFFVSYIGNFVGSLLLVRALPGCTQQSLPTPRTARLAGEGRELRHAATSSHASTSCVDHAARLKPSLIRAPVCGQVYMVYQTGLFGATSAPVGMAVAKTSLTFSQAFFRGVLCNFLVCIAIVQASSAHDFAGKAVRSPAPRLQRQQWRLRVA